MEMQKDSTITDDKSSKEVLSSKKEGVFIISAYLDMTKERQQVSVKIQIFSNLGMAILLFSFLIRR